jgi:hypothetical protein
MWALCEEFVAVFGALAPDRGFHFDPVTAHGAVGAIAALRDDAFDEDEVEALRPKTANAF